MGCYYYVDKFSRYSSLKSLINENSITIQVCIVIKLDCFGFYLSPNLAQVHGNAMGCGWVIKAVFGCRKTFSGKYIFFGNANFRKMKIFLCVWLYFKKFSGKYFLVFGKEGGKHKPRKHTSHNPEKKKKIINDENVSSSTTAVRSRSEIAIDGAITISRRRRDHDCAVDHDRRS